MSESGPSDPTLRNKIDTTKTQVDDLHSQDKVSRRFFLTATAAGAGVGLGVHVARVLNFFHINVDAGSSTDTTGDAQNVTEMTVAEAPTTPEWLGDGVVEFGFNTHVRMNPGPGENLTLDRFRQSVDFLRAFNQQWIRFDVRPEEVAMLSDPDHVAWNNFNLGRYDEAIDYARNAGLKIALPTAMPGMAAQYTHEQYLTYCGNFYRGMAERWQGKIDVYQVFNEVDVHNYLDYSEIGEMSDEYLEKFGQVVATASEAIRSQDPAALITVNFSYWFGRSRDNFEAARKLFAAVNESIDIISLDFYPDTLEQAAEMPNIMRRLSEEFGKPIQVAELGISTNSSGVETQRQIVTESVNILKTGEYVPETILIYELTDETTQGSHENGFGVLTADGTPKDSFADIMPSMNLADESQPEAEATPLG